MNYYDEMSSEFIETTINLDMSHLYNKFCPLLPTGGSILDLGCGPGRDLKYFKEQGFNVIGLEPAAGFAEHARSYTNCEVVEETIQDFNYSCQFDGVWACASLLHLNTSDLINAFKKLFCLLNSGGVIYCSFKYGEFEGDRNGRFFNDQTEKSIIKYLPSNFETISIWSTKDQRPERNEQWLNLLLRKL